MHGPFQLNHQCGEALVQGLSDGFFSLKVLEISSPHTGAKLSDDIINHAKKLAQSGKCRSVVFS